MFDKMERREALKLAVLGAAGAMQAPGQKWPTKPVGPPFRGLKVGLTSYSTRMLMLEPTLKALQSMEIAYISLKDMHLPLSSTKEERAAAKKKVQDAGLEILGCGVISLKDDEAQIRRALEYTRDIGAPIATVAPVPAALPILDKVIKEFDVLVAIHNHGPGDKNFPSPLGVFEAVQPLDKKMGCCVDVGHTFRLGLDPLEAIRKCVPRLYGVHIKDLNGGGLKPRNVPVGAGVLDIVGMLRLLVEIRFPHLVALEYEAEPENPIPGMAASFGFLRGALAAM